MSRYYKIVVGESPSSANKGFTWTNQIFGQADLGAQKVEFDIWQSGEDEPVGAGYVKIWGPEKQQMLQSSDFNGAPIQVFVGMQPGLPFATAAFNGGQQGLVSSGIIFQAFGNWQGVNQTLDFVIVPTSGDTQSNPANMSFMWKKVQPLSEAINSVLTIAYPTFESPKINIDPNLVLSQDEPFQYSTMTQFASYLRGISKDIVGGDYNGVVIAQEGSQWIVFDGTQPTENPAIPIKAQDLIGQPTWLTPSTVNFTTVMRADLRIGSAITFPPTAALNAITTAQSQSFVRDKNAFAGTWQVSKIRHVGNSRDPNATSWVTVIDAYSNTAPA